MTPFIPEHDEAVQSQKLELRVMTRTGTLAQKLHLLFPFAAVIDGRLSLPVMNGIAQFSRLAGSTVRQADSQSDAELIILVVDDEEEVLHFLGIGLPICGFGVWLASSGDEALEIFREHQSTIDVVLMDVGMPGMTGPEALIEIRALVPGTSVVFMTADSGKYSTEGLMEMSGCDVLEKPFKSLDHVAQRLREAAAITTHPGGDMTFPSG